MVRIYYHRLKKVLKQLRKKERKLIAVDKTKIRLEKQQIQTLIRRMLNGLLKVRKL